MPAPLTKTLCANKICTCFTSFLHHQKDPGILFETEDIEEFQASIAALRAAGGGDEPEPSIGAIIRAMEASKPGTPIFVFTDASASDEDRLNEARSLILIKGVRIYFVLVNLLVDNQGVYGQLATISGGQVLNVGTNDISELASLVSFSALQSRSTIFRQSNVMQSTAIHFFPVDSSIVEIILSISGQDISVCQGS